jgi:hypothetical protein
VAGTSYDVVSMSSLDTINDTAQAAEKLLGDGWDGVKYLYNKMAKDTDTMTEEELTEYRESLLEDTADTMENLLELAGVPYGNGKKLVQAVKLYAQDIQNGTLGEFSGNATSASGQYDRMYSALFDGDSVDAEEATAAMGKLEGLGKDDSKVLSEMKARLKKYSTEMQDAADAKLAGDETTRAQLTEQIVEKLYVGMGIDPDADEDADRRAAVIKSVTSSVQELVDAGLGKDTKAGTTAYTNMLEALSTGDVSEAQSEIDALVKAGKSDTNIRSQLTEQYKQAYIDGTDADREEIIELLVGLKNSEGKAYYTVQDIRKWGK